MIKLFRPILKSSHLPGMWVGTVTATSLQKRLFFCFSLRQITIRTCSLVTSKRQSKYEICDIYRGCVCVCAALLQAVLQIGEKPARKFVFRCFYLWLSGNKTHKRVFLVH